MSRPLPSGMKIVDYRPCALVPCTFDAMTSFQAPRGTTDILPDDQRDRLAVQRVCAELAETFGYAPIFTPTFEDSDLFLRTTGESTDIVQKETYTFEDRGGHSLTLRPEGTPGVCRAYLERGLQNRPQPARLYYIMPMYRFERPQAGRFREFWQFGVEALGDSDPALDAEVIELAWRVLESFGITDVTLLVNSIGDAQSRPAYLEALRSYFAPHADGLSFDDQRRLRENTLRVLDSKDEEVQPLLPDAPKSIDYLSDEANAHWDSLLQSLDALGITYEIDHTLVRGLDYYTRTVFEFVPPDARRQSTILAGGRYDGLIEELGGQPTPGIGFAMGIERVVAEAKKRGTLTLPDRQMTVLVAHIGDAAKASGFQLASELRRAGIAAVLGPPRGLRSQLRYATSIDATHAVIIGDNEIASDTVVLRDLTQGEQSEVARGRLIESLG